MENNYERYTNMSHIVVVELPLFFLSANYCIDRFPIFNFPYQTSIRYLIGFNILL